MRKAFQSYIEIFSIVTTFKVALYRSCLYHPIRHFRVTRCFYKILSQRFSQQAWGVRFSFCWVCSNNTNSLLNIMFSVILFIIYCTYNTVCVVVSHKNMKGPYHLNKKGKKKKFPEALRMLSSVPVFFYYFDGFHYFWC